MSPDGFWNEKNAYYNKLTNNNSVNIKLHIGLTKTDKLGERQCGCSQLTKEEMTNILFPPPESKLMICRAEKAQTIIFAEEVAAEKETASLSRIFQKESRL